MVLSKSGEILPDHRASKPESKELRGNPFTRPHWDAPKPLHSVQVLTRLQDINLTWEFLRNKAHLIVKAHPFAMHTPHLRSTPRCLLWGCEEVPKAQTGYPHSSFPQYPASPPMRTALVHFRGQEVKGKYALCRPGQGSWLGRFGKWHGCVARLKGLWDKLGNPRLLHAQVGQIHIFTFTKHEFSDNLNARMVEGMHQPRAFPTPPHPRMATVTFHPAGMLPALPLGIRRPEDVQRKALCEPGK